MDSSSGGGIDPATQILIAATLLAISGLPGLLFRKGGWGQKVSALLSVVAALIGLPATAKILLEKQTLTFVLSWGLPFGPCEIAVDPLSALFLIPVFLVSACAAVYATAYWPAHKHPSTEPKLTFFCGILASSMAFLLTARNGVLFLVAWETMALSAYFLLTTEHRNPEVRRAGIVYLIATHIGTTALFVMFALVRASGTSFLFPAPHSLNTSIVPASAIFVAALVGFGAKAGLIPFHIWLPGAHANAPSHVSAMMSGVMLKMGVYGILRTVAFFSTSPLWWGTLILVLGAISALFGIVLAASQRDLKRLLAYSSIENIGIVSMGVGVALVGQATGNASLVFFGMAGGLLHLLNHSIFKPLLFFGSGVLIHAVGTREMDRMGGLARRMPWGSSMFLVGAAAICGLPPLNGFVGEFLLYTGFFTDAITAPIPFMALLAPILALVGGVAVVTFVKLYGVVFLGAPRSSEAAHGHEAAWPMLVPMGVLAFLCGAAGIVPEAMVKLVEPAIVPYGAEPGQLASLSALRWLTIAGAALIGLFGVLALAFGRRLRNAPVSESETWGCGYLEPTPRMQYSGVSFADMLVNFFGGVVRPRRDLPRVAGLAPSPARFRFTPTETILERVVTPVFRVAGFAFSFLRRLQHGHLHIYMLYIFATLFLLMIWNH